MDWSTLRPRSAAARRWAARAAVLGAGLMIGAGLPSSATAQDGKVVDAVLEGVVTDVAGGPRSDVTVKLFNASFLVTEATTDETGRYRLRFTYNEALDKTIAVWFLPDDTALIPEIVVLRESFQSKERRLLSPCLQRVPLAAEMTVDVTLLDEKAKLKSLADSECFKSEEE
ncbi:MAG: hypothetical protein GF355_10115 [Candidatus Eisenbacteria bacterium]|nr:hypothetical protein [Candidatus Eisenbacteria bacterium]